MLSDVPSMVLGISGATGVSAGQYGTCAVLMDGTVHCWAQMHLVKTAMIPKRAARYPWWLLALPTQ